MLPIAKAEGKLQDKFLNFERKLAAELIKQWRETYTEALKEIFKSIPSFVSNDAVKLLQDLLLDALGPTFGSSKAARDLMSKYITNAYSSSKSEWLLKGLKSSAKSPLLSLRDMKAISVLTRHNCYWLGQHYGNHIGPKIAKITQRAIDEGMGRDALAQELRHELGSVGPSGYTYWDVVASSAIVRSRSFGAISGMEEAGITEYEILAMGDERMCPTCGELDGTVFSVTETRKVIDRALDITDPEEFKAAMPWYTEPPVGKSAAELTESGQSLPPFHGRCRCTVVMVESYEPDHDLIETGGRSITDAGALNDKNDPDGERREAHAKLYYETMRHSDVENIVRKLSENSGISLKAARKVYQHVFIEEHELDEGIKRFDVSYDIAQSFQRLLSGKNIQKHDIIFLRHEWLEQGIMKRYGYKYRTAHDIVERKYNYAIAADEWNERRDK